MAITNEMQMQVTQLYVALFGRAPEIVGLGYWLNKLDSGDSLADVAQEMFESQPSREGYETPAGEEVMPFYPLAYTTEQIIDSFYVNVLGREADAEGRAYWITKANEPGRDMGSVIVEMIDAVVNYAGNDPDGLVSQSLFVNRADVAYAWAMRSGKLDGAREILKNVTAERSSVDEAMNEIAGIDVAGKVFTLTSGTDHLNGTSDNDVFEAPIMQNSMAGGVSNSLSSADNLDGGAGIDTLKAELVPEFIGSMGGLLGLNQIEIQPRTKSIEIIELEARGNSAQGFLAGGQMVVVDAKKMTAIQKIGSHYSDADLRVENLTTLTDSGAKRNTEAITVVMDHTENGASIGLASDFTVLFDNDYLLSDQATQHTLELRIVNAYEMARSDEPLTGFLEVAFKVGDTDVHVDVSGASTYDEVVDAINAQLAAQGIDSVVASKLPNRPAVFTDDVGGYNQGDLAGHYTPVLLTSTSEALDAGPIALDSNVRDFNGLNTWTDPTTETSNRPITVNIELEKVGRAGDGGDLVVGGMSPVDGGIEHFNIAVRGDATQPSNLGIIQSTNLTLETVRVFDHASWDGASLTVRNRLGGSQELKEIDASTFSGDFSLGMNGGQQAITTKFGSGDDSYNWFSAENDGVSSGKAYSISMGSGDDFVRARLDGDSVDALGESFRLDLGAGDDTAIIRDNDGGGSGFSNGVSQPTMRALRNLEIDAGPGDDSVRLDSYFNFQIDAGSGDDFIHINSLRPGHQNWVTRELDGSQNGNADTGFWSYGQASGPQIWGTAYGGADVNPGVDARVLYNAKLTLSFAGFEKTVNIKTSAADNYVARQKDINDAIKAAIDGDATLSKLLNYSDGTGTQVLNIVSTVGGQNSLAVAIYQPTLVDPAAGPANPGQVAVAAGDLSALRQGLINTTAGDSDTFDTLANILAWQGNGFNGSVNQVGVGNGATYAFIERDIILDRGDTGATGQDILDSGALYQNYFSGGSTDSGIGINVSTIDAGTGSDLVVFHSNQASSNVLKISGDFGTTKVVNFHNVMTHLVNDATAGFGQMGNHALDFTRLLNNEVDPSGNLAGNDQSKVPVGTSLNVVQGAESLVGTSPAATNTNTAVANGVNTIRFVENAAGTQTFASLTADNLVAALNDADGTGNSNYGNLTGALLTPGAFGPTLVGNVQKHIVMVENSLNQGEYKVFLLTSTLDADANKGVTKVQSAGGANQFDGGGAQLLGTLDFGASINFKLVGSADYASYMNSLLRAVDAGALSFTYDANGDGVVDAGEGATGLTGGRNNMGWWGEDDNGNGDNGNGDNGNGNGDNGNGDNGNGDNGNGDNGNGDNGNGDNGGDGDLVVVEVPAAGVVGQADVAEAFTVDVVAALLDVDGTNYQSVIDGFSIADGDVLRLDMADADPAITNLAELNGQYGVAVQENPFADLTLITFGLDANGGEVVTLELTGVAPADWAVVMVEVV